MVDSQRRRRSDGQGVITAPAGTRHAIQSVDNSFVNNNNTARPDYNSINNTNHYSSTGAVDDVSKMISGECGPVADIRVSKNDSNFSRMSSLIDAYEDQFQWGCRQVLGIEENCSEVEHNSPDRCGVTQQLPPQQQQVLNARGVKPRAPPAQLITAKESVKARQNTKTQSGSGPNTAMPALIHGAATTSVCPSARNNKAPRAYDDFVNVIAGSQGTAVATTLPQADPLSSPQQTKLPPTEQQQQLQPQQHRSPLAPTPAISSSEKYFDLSKPVMTVRGLNGRTRGRNNDKRERVLGRHPTTLSADVSWESLPTPGDATVTDEEGANGGKARSQETNHTSPSAVNNNDNNEDTWESRYIQVCSVVATSSHEPVSQIPPPQDPRQRLGEEAPPLYPRAQRRRIGDTADFCVGQSSLSGTQRGAEAMAATQLEKERLLMDEAHMQKYKPGAALGKCELVGALLDSFCTGHNTALIIADTQCASALGEDAVSSVLSKACAYCEEVNSDWVHEFTLTAHAVLPGNKTVVNLLPCDIKSVKKVPVRLFANPLTGTDIDGGQFAVVVQGVAEAAMLGQIAIDNAHYLDVAPIDNADTMLCLRLTLKQTRPFSANSAAATTDGGIVDSVYLSSLQVFYVGSNYDKLRNIARGEFPDMWPLVERCFGGQCRALCLIISDRNESSQQLHPLITFGQFCQDVINTVPGAGSVFDLLLRIRGIHSSVHREDTLNNMDQLGADMERILLDPTCQPEMYTIETGEPCEVTYTSADHILWLPGTNAKSRLHQKKKQQQQQKKDQALLPPLPHQEQAVAPPPPMAHIWRGHPEERMRALHRPSAVPIASELLYNVEEPKQPQEQQEKICESGVPAQVPNERCSEMSSLQNSSPLPLPPPHTETPAMGPELLNEGCTPPPSPPSHTFKPVAERGVPKNSFIGRPIRTGGNHTLHARLEMAREMRERIASEAPPPPMDEVVLRRQSERKLRARGCVVLIAGDTPRDSNIRAEDDLHVCLNAPENGANGTPLEVWYQRDAVVLGCGARDSARALLCTAPMTELFTNVASFTSPSVLLSVDLAASPRQFAQLPVVRVLTGFMNNLIEMKDAQTDDMYPVQISLFGVLMCRGKIIADLVRPRALNSADDSEEQEQEKECQVRVGSSQFTGPMIYTTSGIKVDSAADCDEWMQMMMSEADHLSGSRTDTHVVITCVQKGVVEPSSQVKALYKYDAVLSSITVVCSRNTTEPYDRYLAGYRADAVSCLLNDALEGPRVTTMLLSVDNAGVEPHDLHAALTVQARMCRVISAPKQFHTVGDFVVAQKSLLAAQRAQLLNPGPETTHEAYDALQGEINQSWNKIRQFEAYLKDPTCPGFVLYAVECVDRSRITPGRFADRPVDWVHEARKMHTLDKVDPTTPNRAVTKKVGAVKDKQQQQQSLADKTRETATSLEREFPEFPEGGTFAGPIADAEASSGYCTAFAVPGSLLCIAEDGAGARCSSNEVTHVNQRRFAHVETLHVGAEVRAHDHPSRSGQLFYSKRLEELVTAFRMGQDCALLLQETGLVSQTYIQTILLSGIASLCSEDQETSGEMVAISIVHITRECKTFDLADESLQGVVSKVLSKNARVNKQGLGSSLFAGTLASGVIFPSTVALRKYTTSKGAALAVGKAFKTDAGLFDDLHPHLLCITIHRDLPKDGRVSTLEKSATLTIVLGRNGTNALENFFDIPDPELQKLLSYTLSPHCRTLCCTAVMREELENKEAERVEHMVQAQHFRYCMRKFDSTTTTYKRVLLEEKYGLIRRDEVNLAKYSGEMRQRKEEELRRNMETAAIQEAHLKLS